MKKKGRISPVDEDGFCHRHHVIGSRMTSVLMRRTGRYDDLMAWCLTDLPRRMVVKSRLDG